MTTKKKKTHQNQQNTGDAMIGNLFNKKIVESIINVSVWVYIFPHYSLNLGVHF